ncbi:hypothetical protein H6F88_31700 [Oculatella sp. FACHB-28]|uniref:hypothetical protein n=1 Tax=Oculatella sp. FACHB-28 TaxID=2692845 RepID=UPI001689CCC4|nr:hypothetical protein [Oculatella sp. FACHB-28]MBD2060508.1 hypothetical protein [Oculatella sp. FACHB-28]
MANVRLDDIQPISNADYLMTIEGLDAYWTEFSGIQVNYTRAKYNDGLSNVEGTTSGGKKVYQDVTISKPFDPEQDAAVIQWIQSREDGSTFDMTVRPVRKEAGQYFRGNRAWRLSGCRIMNANYLSAVDTNGGDEVSMIGFTFTLQSAVFN